MIAIIIILLLMEHDGACGPERVHHLAPTRSGQAPHTPILNKKSNNNINNNHYHADYFWNT